MLLQSAEVAAITSKIYPVVTDEAVLPYIVYGDDVQTTPTKSLNSVDKATVDIDVLASTYEGCMTLAEAVRAALDHKFCKTDELNIRGIYMTHAAKTEWADGAYIRTLTFSMEVSHN